MGSRPRLHGRNASTHEVEPRQAPLWRPLRSRCLHRERQVRPLRGEGAGGLWSGGSQSGGVPLAPNFDQAAKAGHSWALEHIPAIYKFSPAKLV